jgi:heavy metal translocating P-type ATPase
MKRISSFLREYRLFTFAIIAGLIGLGLQLSDQSTATKWFISIVAVLQALPFIWDMIQDIRTGHYGINLLPTTAIVTSVVLGEYWAALLVVIMLTGGKSLEDYAERRAKTGLIELLKRAPIEAHILKGRRTIDVGVHAVTVSDKLHIKPGEMVPVDGIILEGSTTVDESSLTGESMPQLRQKGDTILSGSIVVDGALTVRATATARDSQFEQIIRLVRSAISSHAPFARLAERYSIPFTVTSFAIAGAVWVVSGDPVRFLQVIIVATPCPLLLAAPIALVSGLSRASKHGIIVKTGSVLERLAQAETIAFAKTGTLTHGQLHVATVKTFHGHTTDSVLASAASLEQNSNHVVARAIVHSAITAKIKFAKAKHVREISGRGVEAKINNSHVLVGRLALLQEHDIVLPAKFESGIDQTAAYVAINNQLAGIITFTDEIRNESGRTLQSLKRFGIKNIVMMTGDGKTVAQKLAKQLGISAVHADMVPAEKLWVIENIKRRPVVFVGDGISDAPVLTVADIGIALGARVATAASGSGDVVILQDDISRVAEAVAVAKRTLTIARQSIFVGIGLSLLLMAAFATGKFPPLLGAVLQEVVEIVVIFNALRARGGSQQHS